LYFASSFLSFLFLFSLPFTFFSFHCTTLSNALSRLSASWYAGFQSYDNIKSVKCNWLLAGLSGIDSRQWQHSFLYLVHIIAGAHPDPSIK
jgi:hypothetical protein